MNEQAYAAYVSDAKRADELHATIKNIAAEEGWLKGVPEALISNSKLHSYALCKGLITREERNLLCRFYN